MRINLRCPHCRTELAVVDLSRDEVPCPSCRQPVRLRITERMRRANVVEQCAVCDCPQVYVQKDFNRAVGVGIFVAGAVLFLACAAYNRLIEGTLVWAVFVVADAVLYKLLPDVTICYKCHTQYRQVAPHAANQPFELGLAEKYDPLDKRPAAENPAAAWKER